ncbi:MAG TPA: hypothetical protein VJ749_16320 [Pyrinomonadaceae bacterium]|jgi:hypothetical protein|nr:hypothetical protein [Pyrinomonadaceae bacterium]
MRKLILILGCALALVHPTAILSQVQSGATSAEKLVKHGGKIDSKYDGFNYETVLRLQKMKVTCDGVRDNFVKDACVSIEVSLHCPGVQLNYVRNVTLQIMFENKDWVHGHPLDQRDLRVVTDTETLKLGRMQLANTAVPGKWDTKLEVLETTIPYAVFRKMAQSQSVEMQVGQGSFELREKNRLALRDLDSRVVDTRAKN